MAAVFCGDMIPVELWWEILLRAPTKDVARSSCVSKQWRGIVSDPSFRKLHHDRHAALNDDVSDTLLVARADVDGESVSSVFPAALVSPAVTGQAPICRVNNPYGYSLTNVCNGFLCFASWSRAKVIVCNPVTGEKLALPRAPHLGLEKRRRYSRPVTFALGFSPTTGAYKLFRFADRRMDVYPLAAAGGWRQHPFPHPYRVVQNTPTIVVGGKICMLTANPASHQHPNDVGKPGPVMVVDVASEEYRTYNPADYGCLWADMAVSGFELHGRLCLAIRSDTEIHFWKMPVEENDALPWQMLYKLKVDKNDVRFGDSGLLRPTISMRAWLDGDTHTLCYGVDNKLYSRYVGTTMTMTTSLAARCLSPTEVMSWDCKIRLPTTPPWLVSCNWNIYTGYRPSLLSPLTLASQQDNNDDDEDEGDESRPFVRRLSCALRHQKSQKRRMSPTSTDHTNGKRVCYRNPCIC
uniref:F-box domain-containing protein n=1 Tax=Oryza glumipatula TaxID=40148 RepID=A0A0E0A307_9ORYZ